MPSHRLQKKKADKTGTAKIKSVLKSKALSKLPNESKRIKERLSNTYTAAQRNKIRKLTPFNPLKEGMEVTSKAHCAWRTRSRGTSQSQTKKSVLLA